MWANPAVQENLERLKARGVKVLDPEAGELACGAVGYGRLPETETIMEALAGLVSPQDLAGRNILVTAGPTHEDLDPVRFLTNRSSGKQGYALAQAAWRRGAAVCLISGPTRLPRPHGVEFVAVRSGREMLDAVKTRFPECDALLMAAAVGDYHFGAVAAHKIKRGQDDLTVHLVQNPDILKAAAKVKQKQVLVGFAAETQDLEAAARSKLTAKGLDLIVANEVGRPDSGFAVDTNEVTIIGRKILPVRLPLLSKEEVADRVLDEVAALLPRL
jgi:phosphopantothenoylcysteine decarboxylase/phosphopantothenate--cysteine ligase